MGSSSFRDLELGLTYTTADDPLNSFYIPVLERAVRMDRNVGYFTSWALALAARGLAELLRNGGTVRLLVGAQLDPHDVEAIKNGAVLEDVTAERLVSLFDEPRDQVQARRLEALAWMVAVGSLEIRVSLPRDTDGLPIPAAEAQGYYHPKVAVFIDSHGDRICSQGSINETANAYLFNYETFSVYRSWESGQLPYLTQHAGHFERVWRNEDPGWVSIPVPEAARSRLLKYQPAKAPQWSDPEAKPNASIGDASYNERVLIAFLRDIPRLIHGGATAGTATVGFEPWPHQRRVASRAVMTFPERYLLADEVGLGKTIEAGLILRDLMISGEVERCLVLAPKSILTQWQDELREKFSLEVPIYDGHRLVGPRPDRVVTEAQGSNPWDEGPIILASSQLAKHRARRGQVLSASEWDLVVLDEAHHARRKDFLDLRTRRPNRLLELLEGVDGLPGLTGRARGLLLLTATPMQVHPVEVWDLLSQLGLGGRWGASETGFLRYFSELRRARSDWESTDWRFLAAMASDELRHGGWIEEEVDLGLERSLGIGSWYRIRDWPDSDDPRIDALKMSEDERAGLLRLLHHLTPLRRKMFRHTRPLLRRYREQGLLPKNIADREPDPRWIKMASDEEVLYTRIEEYISDFYRRYEGERKGLGFVMTVYRRRLTSSFYALEQSLKRRLAFLKGETEDLGLTDEDTEEEELSGDLGETLEATGGRPGSSFFAEEITYVEDFLGKLRNLGSDTKFDQLIQDLNSALEKRDSVVLFTQYADTMDYLRDRLRDVYGQRLACYSGRGGEWWSGVGWTPVSKEDVKQGFHDGEIQILLGTEALAEGLNLQTCGVEINYDVPWNPMRLEQRIGRIDRIGQLFEKIWIWNYFYRDTVEALVYERLVNRIDLFKGVIGQLQPILHNVSRIIERLALEGSDTRQIRLEEQMDQLERDIDQAKQEGLDIDTYMADSEATEAGASPLISGELEEFLTSSTAFGWRFREHPTVLRAYYLAWDGRDWGVTFDGAVADAHPDSLRLLTFGDRVLGELLQSVALRDESRLGVARVHLLQPERNWVAWYTPENGDVTSLRSFHELRKSLDSMSPSASVGALAEEAFAHAVADRLQSEHQQRVRREQERLSAVVERGRTILERAAVLHVLRSVDSSDEVVSLTEMSVEALASEGYPFSALYAKVDEVGLSPESREWLALRGKPRRQLDGLWTAVRQDAKQFVAKIVEAEHRFEEAALPGIEPEASVEVL